jgi:hypothetical protein
MAMGTDSCALIPLPSKRCYLYKLFMLRYL